MNTASKLSLVLIVAGLMAAGISSLSQATPTAVNHRLDKLAGAWSVEATPGQSAPFPGLFTFHADGSLLNNQLPASAFETPGYGNWIATSPTQAAYTFLGLFSNEDGSLFARAKVVGKLQYDPRADTWSGSFSLHAFDADGTEFWTDTGTMTATRIEVEILD
jgi:hypothetical protein